MIGRKNIGSPGRSISTEALQSYKVVWITVLFVALFQVCYSAGFIARTSFVIEGKRYFCLFDDAMISMRYAANWANGEGFVWNPGERVEGYTNFAWTTIMGLCHLLRLSPSHTCLLVQVLGIPVLWCCLVSTLRLARSCRLPPLSACCAIVMAGTFYNLMFFTLFGMETGLLVCLVTFALADSAKCIQEKQGRLTPMLWFAPAVLVRIDILPVLLFVFAFLCISVKRGWRPLILGLPVVIFVLLIHFLWRHHFYGEWLPNTYYLKATGWPLKSRILAGIRDTFWTGVTLGFPVLLALMAMLKPKRWHFLLFGGFALCAAYQLYIGGDAWPLNRFVLPTSLGLFVLAAAGIDRTMKLFTAGKTGASGITICVVLTLLTVIAINSIHWDHFLFVTRPQTTVENRMNIRYVLAVEKVADPDASVAVGWAGTFPYFSQCRCFDLLGKCDAYIANLPAYPDIRRAGHNKWDLMYSLDTYKPDVILHATDATNPILNQDYWPILVEVDGTELPLCIRKDSPKVEGGKTVGWLTFNECFSGILNEIQQNF